MHFEVLNLRGPACIERIVVALQLLSPHAQVQADLATGRVYVAGALTARDVETALASLGYPAYLQPWAWR